MELLAISSTGYDNLAAITVSVEFRDTEQWYPQICSQSQNSAERLRERVANFALMPKSKQRLFGFDVYKNSVAIDQA